MALCQSMPSEEDIIRTSQGRKVVVPQAVGAMGAAAFGANELTPRAMLDSRSRSEQ